MTDTQVVEGEQARDAKVSVRLTEEEDRLIAIVARVRDISKPDVLREIGGTRAVEEGRRIEQVARELKGL